MTNAASGLPFDDIRNLVKDIPGPDADAVAACRAREGQLTKPPGALGRLESLSEWLCAWQGHHPPKAERIVDLQFGYEFQSGAAKGLSILVQVNNATNEPYRELDSNGTQTKLDTYGRTVLFGVTYKF